MFKKYVGSFWGCTTVAPDAIKYGTWILTTGPFGVRHVKLIGDPGDSGHADWMRGAVMAWQAGGPAPVQRYAAPSPIKKAAKDKAKPKGAKVKSETVQS